jgi:hypothetical protein
MCIHHGYGFHVTLDMVIYWVQIHWLWWSILHTAMINPSAREILNQIAFDDPTTITGCSTMLVTHKTSHSERNIFQKVGMNITGMLVVSWSHTWLFLIQLTLLLVKRASQVNKMLGALWELVLIQCIIPNGYPCPQFQEAEGCLSVCNNLQILMQQTFWWWKLVYYCT